MGAARTEVADVAALAAEDSGVAPDLLGSYLHDLIRKVQAPADRSGLPLGDYRDRGELAALQGIRLAPLLDLYLSATWRLWAQIGASAEHATPSGVAAAAAIIFRAADEAAEALAEGYERAQRQTVRLEESLRREFVDDLLAGLGTAEALVERADRFAFNLAGSHHVVVARAGRALVDAGPVQSRIAAHVARARGTADVIVSTKDGLLVCVYPGADADAARDLAQALSGEVDGPWALGVGRPGRGPGAVATSYREARQALDFEARLGRGVAVARFEDLLAYRVMTADRSLLADLVARALGPLSSARGGAQPLIDTIAAFVAESGNTSACARALHLSPRAVAYRLARITELTGYSLTVPEDRFVLELALRGRALVEAQPG